jgi:2-keto-4-pentenoate hydratase
MPQLSDIAGDLARAWRSTTPTTPPSSTHDLSLDDAYAVQPLVSEMLDLGERRGWKLGLTGLATTSGPMCGSICEEMVVADGGSIPMTALIRPRIEVEVAVAFDVTVPPAAGRETIASLPMRAAVAFEVIDDRTTDGSGVVDWVADLATMARVVIGQLRIVDDLHPGELAASLFSEDVRIASGRCEDIIGDPLGHVVWLSRFLAQRDEQLEAGEVVITGSLTGQHLMVPGVRYRGEVSGLPPVQVST